MTDPSISANRAVEKAGVLAVQAFFESNGCVFQPVAQENDFGKDAYVDVGQAGRLTPLCIALQIKSGTSYRSGSGDYAIPLRTHANVWRHSTVPVFGFVYDPDDLKIRWIDLTAHLRSAPELTTGTVPIACGQVLDSYSLTTELIPAAERYRAAVGDDLAARLLSDRSDEQIFAVLDAWALGRVDARFLILLRRVILDLQGDALRRAIWLLAHATPHPDILWTKRNWIPESVKTQIRRTFRWSLDELVHMFSVIGEEYGRGTLSQDLYSLLTRDSEFPTNSPWVVGWFISQERHDEAVGVMILALGLVDDPKSLMAQVLLAYPRLREIEWYADIERALEERNEFDPF